MAPSYLSEKFSKRTEIHEKQTRQRDSLDITFYIVIIVIVIVIIVIVIVITFWQCRCPETFF